MCITVLIVTADFIKIKPFLLLVAATPPRLTHCIFPTLPQNSTVAELLADSRITGAKVQNLQTQEPGEIPCDGIFISIGREPATEFLKGGVAMDSAGYVVADESTQTNIEGVFAVGDIRTKVLRQIVTAVSDGAVCVHYAQEYLAKTE